MNGAQCLNGHGAAVGKGTAGMRFGPLCQRCLDGWRCTAQVPDRLRGGTRRCAVMGSEVIVVDGRTLCPRCAGQAVAP